MPTNNMVINENETVFGIGWAAEQPEDTYALKNKLKDNEFYE